MRIPKLMLATAICLSSMSVAQVAVVTVKPLTEADFQLLRQDIQASKNDIITHTMQFTDAESKAFWPIYQQYAAAQKSIGDQRWAVIKDYAQNYDTMNDAKASAMAAAAFKTDDETIALRKQYFPKFTKAIGAKQAAKFFQVDNRLTLMINVQVASVIPLIP